MLAYLEQYAAAFTLPVELDSRVRRLTAVEGGLRLELDDRTIDADSVVVATGPFQTPFVPALAGRLAPEVFQTHATGYRRPGDVPGETVLVVGGGNTGYQIAAELAATHRVQLAVGARQTPLPQRLLGRDIFWWLTATGLLGRTVDSRLGSRLRHRDTLIGSSPRSARRLGVTLRPRVVDAGDAHVIRNAGGVITDDEIRSLAISQRLLGTEEIMLIHHTDCGMLTFSDDGFRERIRTETRIKPAWAAETFEDLDEDVRQSIARIKASPFIPRKDGVRGFVYDVATGSLREVV